MASLFFHIYYTLKQYCKKPENPLDAVVLGKDITALCAEDEEGYIHGLFEDSKRTNEQFKGIESWDVSNVTDMVLMFYGAESFNQPLNSWDVYNVEDMSYMFEDAKNFNQPLHNWDVSNVTDMHDMFRCAENFNQPLDNFSLEQKKQACYHFDEVKYKKDKVNKNNSSSNSGYIDKVIKLAELREKGLLSEAEFEKMKEDLLK